MDDNLGDLDLLLVDQWQMAAADRCVLAFLAHNLQPAWGVEVGTAQGGSLTALTRFADNVVTIDTDPDCAEALQDRYPSVTFVTGRSQDHLARILAELGPLGRGLVLIDGDHNSEAVTCDGTAVARHQPDDPLIALFHDTANPGVRSGLEAVEWTLSPWVHYVEFGFVPGPGTGWGGLGLVYMLPAERSGPLPPSTT